MTTATMTVDDVRSLIQRNVVDKLDACVRAKAEERKDRQFKVSAWNVGRCERENWLRLNGAEADTMNPRTILTFALGDKVEDTVVDVLIESGVPLIRTNEKRDTVRLEPLGNVRADVFLDVGEGVHAIADVKSMSNASFERAQRGDIGRAYLLQLECYLRAYDERFGVLFCYRKETSHLDFTSNVIERDDSRWAEVLRLHRIATGQDCPPRPYQPSAECSGVREKKCLGGKTPTGKQDHKHCGGTGLEPGGPKLVYPCSWCDVKTACYSRDGLKLVRVDEPGAKHPEWRVTR